MYKLPDDALTTRNFKELLESNNDLYITIHKMECGKYRMDIELANSKKTYTLYNMKAQIRRFFKLDAVYSFCEQHGIEEFRVKIMNKS